jgi:hypothetical protein
VEAKPGLPCMTAIERLTGTRDEVGDGTATLFAGSCLSISLIADLSFLRGSIASGGVVGRPERGSTSAMGLNVMAGSDGSPRSRSMLGLTAADVV